VSLRLADECHLGEWLGRIILGFLFIIVWFRKVV